MRIQEAIKVVNLMQQDGIISSYAIGGAVGATFYIEPSATMDVDVFIPLKVEPGDFISLNYIFEYLKGKGFTVEGEHVIIADTPIQFLPPTSPLVEKALEEAVDRDVEGTPVRVFTAEYIAAIALELGRSKDKLRLVQFIEEKVLDKALFESIVNAYDLSEKWKKFKFQFEVDLP